MPCLTMPRLSGTAFVGAAVLSGAALALMSWPAAAQTTTLTMSSWVSPSHLLTKDVLAVWGQQVEKATDGRVKLHMLPKHPSAAPGTFDAVRDGLVDVSYVTASYTPARHVLPLLAELPGGGTTSVINSVAYSRIHWKYLQQAGEYKGVKLLGVFTHDELTNTAKYGRVAPLLDRERGIYEASDQIAVLYESRMPAVLLEAGMIVNRAEEEVLSSPAFRATVAKAVAEAVKRFCAVR